MSQSFLIYRYCITPNMLEGRFDEKVSIVSNLSVLHNLYGSAHIWRYVSVSIVSNLSILYNLTVAFLKDEGM